jgi:hypothetical protein
MSRESGTRVLYGDFPTLEEQLDTGQTPFPFRSILKSKSRAATIDPEGSGDMRMIITWKEFYTPCIYSDDYILWGP